MTHRSTGTAELDALSERHARWATWALCALVAVAPLWLGGARWDHQAQLAALAAITLALSAWARLGHRMGFPWPLWFPAVVAVLILLQLVPLPPTLLAALSPLAADLRTYSLTDLPNPAGNAWAPLSLDPALTTFAAIHQLAFVGVAWAAANVPHGQRSSVERAVLFGASAVALVGFGHWAVGAERIFGVWSAAGGLKLQGFFSTFVNENTTASLLVLGAFAGLGLATESQSTLRQRGVGACAGLCAAGVFATGSRGGQLALLFGAACFAGFTWLPSARSDPGSSAGRARVIALAALVIALAGLGLSLLLLPDWSASTVAQPNARSFDAKFASWPDAWRHALAFPLTGSGRGAFRATHAQFQDTHFAQTLGYPENIVLQLTSELGLVVGGIALLGGLAAAFVAVRVGLAGGRPRHWAMLAGLVAVTAQQLVDFGLETAGLSLPFAAGLGLVLGRTLRDRNNPAPRARRAAPAVALGLALATGTLIALRAPHALAHLPDAGLALVDAAPDEATAIEAAGAEAAAAHPADAWVPLRVATRLARLPDPPVPRVMRWLNRAIRLAPARGEPHLLAARTLGAGATAPQAAQEYALALERMPWDRNVLMREVVRRVRDPLLLARAIPDAPDHRRVLIQLLREEGDAQRLRAALTAAAERWPDDADVRHALALVCLDQHDLGCASAEIEHLDTSGRTLRASILKARKALIRKDNSAARAELAASRALGARDRDFLLASADIHRRLGDLPAAREDLDRAWPLVALDPPFAAHTLAARGRLELELGDPRHAVTAYEQAYAQVAKPVFAASALAAAKKANAPHLADALLKRARGEFPNAPVLAPAAAPPPLHD